MGLLGIDLGTTNTVAAVDGVALPISGEDGRTTLPSIVSFLPNGTTQVGMAGKRRRMIDSRNTIFSAKRIIGRRWSDAMTQEFRARYPFELIEVEGDAPAFKTRAGVFSPTVVSAMILDTVCAQVRHTPSGIDRAIVTVPAAFGARQREATVAAAQKAGLSSVWLVDEPLATADAYLNVSNPVRRAGIYDLGGGTFDFSVVDWTHGTTRLIACDSDLALGGDDIDLLLAEWVAEEVLKQFNWDLRNYSEIYARLVSECERAKIRLSFFEETLIDLSLVDPDGLAGCDGLPLRGDVLSRISENLVRRSFVTCDAVLAKAGLRTSDLDAVFLAGGSTHLTKVREGVEAYFGQVGRFELEPTEVVALGASQIAWSSERS